MTGLEPDTHTWLAARRLLLNRCDDFYLQLHRVREDFDPEAIHDLRVASRRLREGLALFAGCFRQKQLLPLKQELQTFTRTLGAIRNLDEALRFFTALPPEAGEAVGTDLVTQLQADRDSQCRTLKKELTDLDPDALLERLTRMCNRPRLFSPAAREPFAPIAATLDKALAARGAVLAQILPAALVAENITAQHRLRIAVKHFRYRLEFLAPFAAAGYKKLYATVKSFQELLGQMHDLDVFSGMIPSREAPQPVFAVIAARRGQLFGEFLQLNTSSPLASLGDRARSLL